MFKGRAFGILLFVLCLVIVGCGGSSSSSGGGGNQPAVRFTAPPANPTIELGQSVQLQVTLSGGQGVTWSLQNASGKGTPPGQLTNVAATSATYVAPPMTIPPPLCDAQNPPPAAQQVEIVATSTTDSTQSASISVVIAQSPPCIATIPQVTVFAPGGNQFFNVCPPAGTVMSFVPSGNAQLFQVGVFNRVRVFDGGGQVRPNPSPFGVAPFTWTVISGSLPNGVSLVPDNGTSVIALSGTPVSAGCSTFTLQITDATGVSASTPFFLVVLPPSLKTAIPALPTSYVNKAIGKGIPYPPAELQVSGGTPPYIWNYNPNPIGDPSFPDGLCLGSSKSSVPAGCLNSKPPSSSNIGVISGTPSPGDLLFGLTTQYPVQLQVNDSQQPYPAVGLLSPSMTVDAEQAFCTAAQPLQPAPGLNGGVISGGEVPGDFYLQGSLAFLVRGFDADGPIVMAGSVNLSADGSGSITGGEMDVTRSGGSENLTIRPSGSSYTVGISEGNQVSYNRGCMTLAPSSGRKITFAFSLADCSNHYAESGVTTTGDNACGMKQNDQLQNIAAGFFTTGHVIEFDDPNGKGTRASGIFRLQDTSSFSGGLSGPYAFGISGGSANGHYAAAGSFRASPSSLSSVAADTDDGGALGTQLTGGSGTVGSLDANGRAAATLTVGPASYDLALYMVSKREAILATTDALGSNHPIIGGEAIATSDSFSNASLQNSHMFHLGGLAPNCAVLVSGCPDVSIGLLTFDAIGSFSGTESEDQAGTLGTTALSGAYSVDPATGRTLFSTPAIGQNLGPHAFVAYLIPAAANVNRASCSTPANCVTGFLVGTDSTAQDGVLEFQTSLATPPPPFTSRFLVGDFTYGTDESLHPLTANLEGDINTSPSASSVTTGSFASDLQDRSFGDRRYCLVPGCLLLLPNESLAGSYVINANGTGSLGGETVSVTNGKVVFYIDESPLNLYPTVVVAEQ